MNDLTAERDTAALAGWLRDATRAERVRITRRERLAGGAIQDNWALDVDIDGGAWRGAHRLVLRTDAPSSVASSLTRAQEFAVLRVVHEARVITPEPLFLCRDTDVLGREFFIMRRVPGVAQAHRLTREAALIPDADALARALGSNLARIHAIRPPFQALESFSFAPAAGIEPPPADPALASIAQLRSHLDALDDSHPALEWGLRWCERHAPATHAITLIHGDYRTGNYLVHEGRLTGVLDWEFARWGDPRQDLGWFTARCWRFSRSDLEGGGIAALEPFLAGYESVAGHRISRDDLDYWQAMAHLRWAIIALQQARRHARGGERSLELALTGRIVPELEHEALRLIAGARG